MVMYVVNVDDAVVHDVNIDQPVAYSHMIINETVACSNPQTE